MEQNRVSNGEGNQIGGRRRRDQMGNTASRPQLAVIAWFLWAAICLGLIGSGVALLGGWLFVGWTSGMRYGSGLVAILSGLSAGYLGSIKFFWYVAKWLSKGKVKSGAGSKGPKVVVVGGGTGLGTILRGLKEISANLTAIVTVADDGGSSGRLRREFGILPPGDIRNCLVALADLEPLMEKLMQYRFGGESVFAGHNFGNLFLTAMTNVTGDFEQAIKASGKVLAVRGQVLPATLEHVVLKARLADGRIIAGESSIPTAQVPVERVFLDPADSKPVPEALAAILDADVILLGPGSLYTSIIPNLLVKDIAEAIRASGALKVYVCNAMTQPGETDRYSASQHVQAIIRHGGPGLIDMAIVNTGPIPETILSRYKEEGAEPVEADLEIIKALGISPMGIDIVHKSSVIRHDAQKLAKLVEKLARTQKIGNVFGKEWVRRIYELVKGLTEIFIWISI